MTGSVRRRHWSWAAHLASWLAVAWGAVAGEAGPCAENRYELVDLRQIERVFVQFSEQYRPCVVAIRTYDEVGDGLLSASRRKDVPKALKVRENHGTGFIIESDGLILTNHHVVRGAARIRVILHNGREFDADVRAADPRSDLALLKIEATALKAARLGDAERVRVGQWAIVVGNPFGLASVKGEPSITIGNISALGRDMTERINSADVNAAYYGNLIETSAAVNPGNSGGPLFNLDGEVIGVVTAIETRNGANEGVGFAVPIDRFTRRVIDTLKAGQTVQYGYLGVQPMDPVVARELMKRMGLDGQSGAMIDFVVPGQPASLAGLRRDDVIIEFNGEVVRDWDHLSRLIGHSATGSTADVRYLRQGELHTVSVVIGDRATGIQMTQRLKRP